MASPVHADTTPGPGRDPVPGADVPAARGGLRPAPGIQIPAWHKPTRAPVKLPKKFRRGMPSQGIHSNIDSFAPLLFMQSGPNPGLQAWSIAHHAFAPPAAAKITCVNIADGTHCTDPAGQPTAWPKTLNTQPSALGTLPSALDAKIGDISTTEVPQYITNPLDTSLILYPAVTSTPFAGYPKGSVGVGCLLLATQYNCGYQPLAPLTNNPGKSNTNGLTGFIQVGDEIYGASTDGQVLCYNTLNLLRCDGQPYKNTGIIPNNDKAGIGPQDFLGNTETVNGRVYISSNNESGFSTTPHPPTVTCFDPAAKAPCAGWTPQADGGPDAMRILAIFTERDAQNNAVGVCTVAGQKTKKAPVVTCHDFNGGIRPTPPGLQEIFPADGAKSVVFQPTQIAYSQQQRSYFPFYTEDGKYKGDTLCYNWTTRAACEGFPEPSGHPLVNNGFTLDYGYAFYQPTGCLVGSGHKGWIFGIHPENGTSIC
ncbi:hypothetical protein [Sphaerisporangium rufum]|uniref:hypothetical protein n=1 Tax=Sphaerisporangium rufum TaxID=1381558 RepID=UPI001951189C|nr:hypothetical protein [Sphaerisporangium rufum]